MRSPKRIRGCPPRPELWPGLILQDLKKRRPRLRVRGKSLVHAGGGGGGGSTGNGAASQVGGSAFLGRCSAVAHTTQSRGLGKGKNKQTLRRP